MNDNRAIGIFDSGVGGLSVLLEAEKILPKESFVYFADQANAPFGAKSKKELEQISKNALSFLLKKDVKAVIIACNTATVYAIDYLRLRFSLPIIGTVPVIKTIAQKTKTGKIAVFSTPATAKSAYLSNLIKKYANGLQVKIVGGTGLEEMIENGNISGPKIEFALLKFLGPLIKENVDAVALGCTHYPFVKPKIEELFGKRITVFDSGGAIARRTKKVLENEDLLSLGGRKSIYFTTGDLVKFRTIAQKLLGRKLAQIERAEI